MNHYNYNARLPHQVYEIYRVRMGWSTRALQKERVLGYSI